MLLVMSGCISPFIPNEIAVVNVSDRLKQYEDAIEFYLSCEQITSIVFCDNSNYCYNFHDEIEKAAKIGKRLEIIHFAGDEKMIKIRGKGYGEAELIDFLCDNSSLFNREPFFYKVTGRLIVKNIDQIIKKNGLEKIRINRNIYENNSFDTRLWGIHTETYKKYFYGKKNLMSDKAIRYIEHVYKSIIDKNKLNCSCHRLFPQIKGISGTAGFMYKNLWVENVMSNALCRIQKYNSKYGIFIARFLYYRYEKKKRGQELLYILLA